METNTPSGPHGKRADFERFQSVIGHLGSAFATPNSLPEEMRIWVPETQRIQSEDHCLCLSPAEK